MFLLSHGKVSISIKGSEVSQMAVPVRRPGDSAPIHLQGFGELGLLAVRRKRTATVTCTSAAWTCVLHRDIFKSALKLFPDEAVKFEQLQKEKIEALKGA